ncbi:alpha/beta hydrolase [Nocardia arizonensis]|uniref:alpha/beta hydrolase n=1 Tax=Nocardia arizonensis TaxID=1141647 RepID=UPI0006D15D9C|nr:alpha/beta hydrolase [Nocardia arizonensis]
MRPAVPHPAAPILNALTFQPDREIPLTPAALDLAFADLSMRTSDGQTLHGWWMPARGSRGHVLFAHGNGGTIGDRVPIFAMLTELGFDVLAFDYRGYGRSTGRPSEAGTYLDARAARRTLLEQEGVDPARVLYLGKSLGGGVMVELASEFPPIGVMLMSTFTGIRDAARSVYPFLPSPLVPDAYPSLRRIRSLRAPLLIMHGDRDELLPLRHARRLYEAAPEPKRLEIFPGAGHNDLIALDGGRWVRTVREFADDVLGR